MIASRFRPVGWVAAVAIAALGCYLVSLRVAAQRNQVVGVEAQILATRQDMRRLETELGTRSRLVQLERWNSDVLALAAPKAGQYLKGEMQLASLAGLPQSAPAPAGIPGDGTVQQASYVPPPAAASAAPAPAPAVVAAPVVRVAAVAKPHHDAPSRKHPDDAAPALLREASYHAPAKTKPHHAGSSDKPAHRDAPALLHEASYAVPAKTKPHRAHAQTASARDDDAKKPVLRHANYIKPAADRPAGLRQVALLDDSTLGTIARAARAETGEGKKRRP